MLRALFDRANLCKQSFVAYFGDLRKAFDLIDRGQVLRACQDSVQEPLLARACIDRLRSVGASIWSGGLRRDYVLPAGMAQGDSMGPLAFVLTYHRYCSQLDAFRSTFRTPQAMDT